MGYAEEDADPAVGSGEESQDEDETMEDADGDADDGLDQDATMVDEDEGDEGNDDEDDNSDDDPDDLDDPDSPSQVRLRGQTAAANRRSSRPSDPTAATADNPTVLLTSPSPRPASTSATAAAAAAPSPHSRTSRTYQRPLPRPEAVTAQTYDIVPTMASPQSTSINTIAATPDMRWVFSGGSDGYVRMYNWVETANGKVPLTVAQKHPFVDSVMKAGSLTTYWENEETYPDGSGAVMTAGNGGEDAAAKVVSPVYALVAQREALWVLSGLESGAINLQTCRHQAGTRIATLREHTSAVSVLVLSADEAGVLSGSWDKRILDWDLNSGKVKRTFPGDGGQISALEIRPSSNMPVPRLDERPVDAEKVNGTYSSNYNEPTSNASLDNEAEARRPSHFGDGEDALGSPDGSLFEENDHGSLFGDNDDGGGGAGGGGAFGDDDDDDDFGKALADGLDDGEPAETQPPPTVDTSADAEKKEDQQAGDAGLAMQPDSGLGEATGNGGTDLLDTDTKLDETHPVLNGVLDESETGNGDTGPRDEDTHATTNGTKTEATNTTDETTTLPHGLSTADTSPEQSESTFLDAAIDGTLRIWDRRMPDPIAKIMPQRGTPPWCMGACWSPDGNSFYAGRRNGTVDEYSIHKGGKMDEPVRTLRFPAGSGAVSAVRAMPNGRGLVW